MSRHPKIFRNRFAAFLYKVLPAWIHHIRAHAPLERDLVLLHYQEQTLAAQAGGVITSGKALYPNPNPLKLKPLNP